MDKKLTNKDEIFVREYLITLDPYDAALKAGYSKTVADVKSYVWVSHSLSNPKKHVFNAIQHQLRQRMNKLEVTSERVIEELAKIAFYNKKETLDKNGDELPLHKLDDDIACVVGTNVKDKTQALNTLAKYLGLLTEKVDVTIDDVTKLTPEERKERIERLKQKALTRK
jgi:phage terminase small subunit